jgi:hypothetical protein
MPDKTWWIGKSSTKKLANDLAQGWRDWLASNQRKILADEVQKLLDAAIARAIGKDKDA